MNIFVLAIIGIVIISGVVFGIFMTGEKPSITFPHEYYELTITGLNETYRVGESYSFSYMLSGYGTPCGGIMITYPIGKDNYTGEGSIPACLNSLRSDFVLDMNKQYGRTYGHIALQDVGNYTITIQFEKGVNGPTVAKKNFTVINP